MLTLFFIAWIVSGLVCLADLLERRSDRRHRVATRITVTPRERSNVVSLHNVAEPGSNVRPLVPNPRRWPA